MTFQFINAHADHWLEPAISFGHRHWIQLTSSQFLLKSYPILTQFLPIKKMCQTTWKENGLKPTHMENKWNEWNEYEIHIAILVLFWTSWKYQYLLNPQLVAVLILFSSYHGKPTSRLDPFSEPASYNTRKGLDKVTSTLWGVPSKSLSKWLRGCW